MKVFFDTNVIISAYYFDGNERRTLMMIIGSQHIPVISTQVITEIQKVMKDKFQEKERDVEAFIERLLADVGLVRDYKIEVDIKDELDKNIIGSSIISGCDILVTGDKEIINCDIKDIQIVNAGELLELLL